MTSVRVNRVGGMSQKSHCPHSLGLAAIELLAWFSSSGDLIQSLVALKCL